MEGKGQKDYHLDKAARYEQVAQSSREVAEEHWEQYRLSGKERDKGLAEKYDKFAEQYSALAEQHQQRAEELSSQGDG